MYESSDYAWHNSTTAGGKYKGGGTEICNEGDGEYIGGKQNMSQNVNDPEIIYTSKINNDDSKRINIVNSERFSYKSQLIFLYSQLFLRGVALVQYNKLHLDKGQQKCI